MKQDPTNKDATEQILIRALKSILKARQVSHAKIIAKEALVQTGIPTN